MRKHIISYILSAACALSACSSDYYNEPDPATPGEDEMLTLTVSASQPVTHDGVSSRAKNDDDVLYTEFEKGDSIGVIVMDAAGNLLVDNVLFRYDGTNWIFDADKDGEDKRPYYDAAMTSYIVYFPYTPTADRCTDVDGIKSLERFAHKDNQNSKEDYLYSDIMVWTYEVKEEEKAPKKIEAKMGHVYDTFSLVQPKVKWDIVPTGEEIEYTTMDETLSDLIIEYKPKNGESIVLKDNETNLIYRGTDRSYRYLLPEKQEGTITWQYTYRGITFHGSRTIPAKPSGTRISSSDTGYMGSLPGPKMEFSDFYCSKDTLGKRLGYVIPWDAEECLKGRHCIGLVARVGQNKDDFSDYSGSGIGKTTCQGYVISLTDTFSEPFLVNHGTNNVLPWASDALSLIKDVFTYPIDREINEWSGYYNHHKIIEYAEEKEGLTLEDFPAAYTCEYYGKLVKKNDNGEIEILNTVTGLEAPANTSGWFLPTTHMLYSVSGRDKLTIGGTYYETDGEGYAIDKLFNDRIELIKKYLDEDPLYKWDYIELAKGTFETSYWGANHFKTDQTKMPKPSITYIKGTSYNSCMIDGSNQDKSSTIGYDFHDLRARPFLAF